MPNGDLNQSVKVERGRALVQSNEICGIAGRPFGRKIGGCCDRRSTFRAVARLLVALNRSRACAVRGVLGASYLPTRRCSSFFVARRRDPPNAFWPRAQCRLLLDGHGKALRTPKAIGVKVRKGKEGIFPPLTMLHGEFPLGNRSPAPEVVQWPTPPSGAASPAAPAVAPRPVMH